MFHFLELVIVFLTNINKVLAKWILSCIAFVFIALLFYVVILIDTRRRDKSKATKVATDKEKFGSNSKSQFDLDPLFLLVHLLSFAFFATACTIAYLT